VRRIAYLLCGKEQAQIGIGGKKNTPVSLGSACESNGAAVVVALTAGRPHMKMWASLFPTYPFEPSPQARPSKKGTPTDQPFDNRSIA